MSVRKYFYARISSSSQKEDPQLDAIKNLDIDPRDVYVDKANGKNFDRPEWNALKKSVRSGDVLFIKSIYRLGRNKAGILEQWKWLLDNEIDIVVLDMHILDTRQYKELNGVGELITSLVLEILAWLAEEERVNIKQRQKEGIESAKLRNVKFGRLKIQTDDNFKSIYKQWKDGILTAKNAMKVLEFKSNTFYRRVAEYEELNKEVVCSG
ncbi:recombinase family protein [Clostridium beijerinckii]|uniref:Recombinase family protein n=1 Tax=Clostridium beijerinckii TaxID=1520 RepID=A0AAW3W6G5_CLOBE|nr:recombinase family protein [Clostridium beijerinckii]MBC2457296.1 recombinase family protein [Clostridium beijerinckii]MBC2474352.1 recombinase family protein [Clostridium beijerinckii]NOV59013.1 DNA invertase Pin-like site-specific DNA recombinase [Clostridium beijerinckii]NOV71599.1 DNA invertase Pin-like site-specific DNA recombinase [Clostridium beijerinckii]NOW32368.1 DNA invertase Pin-like site-specific DNA recombinase [Clostridium beijerinckii]